VILFRFSRKFRFKELEKYSFAAQTAAEKAALEALSTGMKNVEILVKGQGSGRETAIRAIEGAGFDIISIQDITSVPHNGCRPPNDVVFRISISNKLNYE
jgi:small subunit ribosomal protein S11